MKKIKFYIVFLASAAIFTACELNDYPEFDDANAFVAFTSERISVNEDTTANQSKSTFQVPVRLTSLKAKNTTVTFEIMDGTAVQGRDFELVGGATVLTFDGSTAVKNIDFKQMPHVGEYTGDRQFGIRITSSGSVKAGSIDTVYVAILDLDHPLAFILGSFTATATSYFNGSQSWTVTFAKDISDVTKVWITNLVAGGSSASTPVYGIVNAEKTEIKIPVGQTIAASTSYDVFLKGFYGPDGEDAIEDGGSITGLIDPDGTIHIQDEFGSQVFTIGTTTSAGWYNIFQADGIFRK